MDTAESKKLSIFELPKEPIDGYRLECLQVTTHGSKAWITPVKFVYHANRSWDELYPDDPDRGVPFVDAWQVFESDRCTCRACGWQLSLSNYTNENGYFVDFNGAVEFLRQAMQSRQRYLTVEMEATQRTLARLSDARSPEQVTFDAMY